MCLTKDLCHQKNSLTRMDVNNMIESINHVKILSLEKGLTSDVSMIE